MAGMLLLLDVIALGATVRVTTLDDSNPDAVQRLSVRDFIMHMCEKDNIHASEVWRRLPDDVHNEVHPDKITYKFPGRGQKEQPVITFPNALKLAMHLPGKKAKENRSAMVNFLVRYLAGDKSLLKVIKPNAASDSPVAQTVQLPRMASPSDETTVGFRRRREELELEEEIKAEIRAMSRARFAIINNDLEELTTPARDD
jgi:hypothetical protein